MCCVRNKGHERGKKMKTGWERVTIHNIQPLPEGKATAVSMENTLR